MARRGKKINSSFRAPTERHPLTRSARTGLSDTPEEQQEIYRRLVPKEKDGIVEKILLMLLVACIFVLTILLLL